MVNPVPEGYRRVTPYLIVDGAAAAIDFYTAVFGATERMRMAAPEGKVGHAELEIGDSVIMLADEHPEMNARGPRSVGGTNYVDEWVSLGGPNHGTNLASLCFWQTSCIEMRAGSSFLSQLNSGDETPGAVRYGTWWSPCDEVINPDSSILLSGATNTQTACILHSGYYSSSTVYGQVRDFVR